MIHNQYLYRFCIATNTDRHLFLRHMSTILNNQCGTGPKILSTVFYIIAANQADLDNGGSNNGGEVNNMENNNQIVNNVFGSENQHNSNPDLGETIIHIGGGGIDTVFQEIVPASSVTPPKETVNNFLYEEQLKKEEEMSSQGGVLAPLYVEVSHDFPLSVHIRLSPPVSLSEHSRLLSFHLSLFPRPSPVSTLFSAILSKS